MLVTAKIPGAGGLDRGAAITYRLLSTGGLGYYVQILGGMVKAR